MKKIMFLPFGMFFLLLAASGYASTNVTQCAVLNQNNTVYTLNTSFTNTTANPCISITGFNDTFDCQEYTMIGSASNNGIEIYWESGTNTNNTIKNCKMTAWYDGIYLNYTVNNILINNTFNSNAEGIHIDSSSNSTLTNNTFNSNNYGIYIDSSSNNTLTSNIFNINSYGIYLGSSSNNTLSNNTANNNTDGIYLDYSSNNTLSNNTASNNTVGIYTSDSNNNTISNNIVNNNTNGIFLSSSNNVLTNNRANNNTIGIYILSSNNTLSNNTANSNTDGIYLASSSNNTLTNNIANNNTYGIFLSGSNNTLTNNTAINNDNGITLYLSSNNNTISGGSIYSSTSADYHFYMPGTNNNFTNTNFTSARKIYFNDSTSWFNYANDTSGLWLQINNINDNTLTRTLNSWSTTNISWNESDSSTDTANYTIYGLTANTFYAVSNNSVNRYTINSSSCGCINFTIGLTTSSQTIQVMNDTTPSTWYTNQSSSPATYSSTTPSQFNITWNDTLSPISIVLITIRNSTNSSHIIVSNSTMTNSYGGNIYNYSVVLPAGSWNWTSYANDSANNWNVSGTWTFTISKAPTLTRLFLNGTEGNRTYNFSQIANLTATVNASGLGVIFSWPWGGAGGGGLCVPGPCSSWGESDIPINAFGLLNITGTTLNITGYTGGNDNYSASSQTYYINVTKGVPTLNIYVDGISNNETIVYPSISNISAGTSDSGNSDCNYTLWRNDTPLVNGSSALDYTQLGNGTYAFKYNTTGCNNWISGSSQTLYLYVDKGTLSGSITGGDVTYPASVDIIPSESNTGDADVNYTFWRNGALISSANGTNPTADTSQISAGTYTYLLNSSGGANWTANSSISTLTITVSAASSFVPSGGGGGPTTTTPTTKVTVIRGNANITVPSIAAEKMANVTIAKTEDVDFRQVNISVANSVNNIKIVITKLSGSPASVTHAIEGKVYHYIEVDKTNFTDTDVSKVYIKFAVNKTWFTDNAVATSNISLYRWTNNKWSELATTFLSNDSYEDFYQAESPGFSYFLIGTQGGETTVTPQAPVPCTESWTCTDWSACTNGQQTRICTDANDCGTTALKPIETQNCEVSKEASNITGNISWVYPIIAVVIIAIIVVIAIIFRKKSKVEYVYEKNKLTESM